MRTECGVLVSASLNQQQPTDRGLSEVEARISTGTLVSASLNQRGESANILEEIAVILWLNFRR